MFYERPGSVKILYTIDATGMEPTTGVYMYRAIIPETIQVEFWAEQDGISWRVRVQGGVVRRDGTAGAAIQEHEFSDFWNKRGHAAPDSILTVVEHFQPRAAAAIAAGRE